MWLKIRVFVKSHTEVKGSFKAFGKTSTISWGDKVGAKYEIVKVDITILTLGVNLTIAVE